ncbi:MAG: type II toxin-antitoxin system VapC family toxin [Rudaea sp.]|uniref:type II toxin-antitoxin system VapC family toxin n=1 Tax=Rudaea sp. TaxID=2136325 RepID=UPI0039E2FFCB
MKIVADTNVLLRVVTGDDPAQARVATRALERAELVAVSLHALCELAWVLQRSYGVSRADTAAAIRQLAETRNVAVDRPAVEAGLAMLEAGGDFADGIIAFEGRWLGGETFVSFDKQAVRLLKAQGLPVHSL